jgi:hypothetical protein
MMGSRESPESYFTILAIAYIDNVYSYGAPNQTIVKSLVLSIWANMNTVYSELNLCPRWILSEAEIGTYD